MSKVALEAKVFKQHMDYDKTKPSFAKASAGEAGQTLVALLFFVMVGMIVTTAAVMILSTNSQAAQKLSQGEVTRQMAETGAENALLRLLRDKTYPGETLTDIGGVAGDNVEIKIDSTNGIITSTARSGNFKREIEVTYTFNDKLEITSWKEIY